MADWWFEMAKSKLRDLGFIVIPKDSVRRLQTQAVVDKSLFHYADTGDGLMHAVHSELGQQLGHELMKHVTIEVTDGDAQKDLWPDYRQGVRTFKATVDVLT